MSSIFPIRETVSLDREREPRLVELDEETADEVFEALASRTTRKIFLALHKQPQTASDLAEVTDTSVQNVQYHLEKLTDADLVEIVDTWYSERGSEMKVYAPEDESLVLFAGRDKQSTFRSLLSRLVGLLSFLVPPSILVAWLANRSSPGAIGDTGFRGQSADSEPESPTDGDAAETIEDVEEEADGAGSSDDGSGGDGGGDVGTTGAEDTATPEAMDTQTPAHTPDAETPIATRSANDTPASDATDTPEAVDAGTETPLPTETPGNETLSNAAEPTPQIPAEAADNAAEIAGLDPAIAAGLAFFLGGLFVYTVLSYRSTRV